MKVHNDNDMRLYAGYKTSYAFELNNMCMLAVEGTAARGATSSERLRARPARTCTFEFSVPCVFGRAAGVKRVRRKPTIQKHEYGNAVA